MRIRSHRRFKLRTFFIIILAISPSSFFGIYIVSAVNKMNQAVQFGLVTPPDPSTFIQANFTRLDQMAKYYDTRYEEYHIPLNFSTDTIFTSPNCTVVKSYAFSDNGAQWTGLALTGYIFKYVTAVNEGNQTLKEDALRVITKLISGMSMLLAVPNGGIGPNYSGILARGWADPAHKDIAAWYFSNDSRMHNGTGIYSQYRWRGFTSNDEYSGLYSGLALTLKFVNASDAPNVIKTVKLMIEQVTQYMINTNFLGIDWNGAPTGVDQKPRFFTGGLWVLLVLKTAAIADPQKYESIYDHYATEEFYAAWSQESNNQELVGAYYAYAFGYHVCFSLLMLEDQPGPLHNLLMKIYLNGLRSYTKNDRNPFFNAIQLILCDKPGMDPTLEHDVEDQLMRYDCPYHFPDRALGHANITTEYQPANNFVKLINSITQDPMGSIYLPILTFMDTSNNYTDKPLTIEYLNGNIFLWEKNPFVYNPQQNINPDYEYAGFSFSLIYWMMSAFGFFPNSGISEND